MDDLRYGLRGLMKNRGFAAVAILSLALGIGANTTIFTFLNAIFLRPLPVNDPAGLVAVFTLDPRFPGYLPCSYPNYKDYRDHNQSFSSLLLYSSVSGSLTEGEAPQPVLFQMVSGNYFQTLGVKPVAGRAFLPEEDSPSGGYPVAVISHALWMRRFGGDQQITAHTLEINGHVFRVVGVAPPGFQGVSLLTPVDVWVPMATYAQVYPEAAPVNQRRALLFSVVGRLKPGVSMPGAQAEMQILSQDLEREYPRDNEGRRATLLPLAESAINPRTRAVMTASGSVLLVITGLVLLIACANVANLLLARAAGRGREIAIRLALGAGRGRLVRQLLTESTVLALAGGGLGLVFAGWARNVLWSLRPPLLSAAVFHIELDGRVLAFTLGVSLLTGILFGLMPALRSTRPDLATGLKERTGLPASGVGGHRTRSVLVTLEIALCVISLVGAGLFVRSLNNAQHIEAGFDTEHLGMVTFNVAGLGYDAARSREFQNRALERASAAPGVVSAAISKDPMFRVSLARTALTEDDPRGAQGRVTPVSPVSPNYFQTTGIALLRGRDFSVMDTVKTPRVAIINEAAAARFWPNREAIGRRVGFLGDDAPLEVIGIARNANYTAVGEAPQALIYTAFLQENGTACAIIFRASRDPQTALASVLREVQAVEPHLLLQSTTVSSVIATSLWVPRLSAGLLSVFGILGLLLASVGIYGVISYSVHQRTREIGIRMALGASPANVQALMLGEVLRLITLGVSGGSLIAMAGSQTIRSLLFVSGTDVSTFVLVPAILVLVALLASWMPVIRATHIDPATALRQD